MAKKKPKKTVRKTVVTKTTTTTTTRGNPEMASPIDRSSVRERSRRIVNPF